jgi:hypothetical protein
VGGERLKREEKRSHRTYLVTFSDERFHRELMQLRPFAGTSDYQAFGSERRPTNRFKAMVSSSIEALRQVLGDPRRLSGSQ